MSASKAARDNAPKNANDMPPIEDRSAGNFFIGWSREVPQLDRRFLLGASLALLGLGAGSAAMFADHALPPGPGHWDQADLRDFQGLLIRKPYLALRTLALDGEPRTAFLATYGKENAATLLPAEPRSGPVTLRASPVQRGENVILATTERHFAMSAIHLSPDDLIRLTPTPAVDLGPARFLGEVIDAKCWFGAMRPGSGIPHRACASLCLRGGLPIGLCAGDALCVDGAETLPLLLDENGAAHGLGLLPFIGQYIIAEGRLVRQDDVISLHAGLRDIRIA